MRSLGILVARRKLTVRTAAGLPNTKTIKNKVQQVLDADHHEEFSGKGKTVLITGGSGFVTAHFLNSFLSRGYNVRTTVRSAETAEKVKKSHSKCHRSQLSFAIVLDVQTPGEHDEAVKGVDGVISHCNLFATSVKNNEKDLLNPAIKGTTSVLTSIQKHNPQVKRVVITSSFASFIDNDKGPRPGYTYTEKNWNPVTYDAAAKKDIGGGVAYAASKTFSEKAAYDFVEKYEPNFTVSCICPPMIYGPRSTSPTSTISTPSSTDIYRLMNGSEKTIPDTTFFAFVDVHDICEAHLRAYETSAAAGQSYFCTAGGYTYQQVCDITRKDFPKKKNLVPEGNPGAKYPDAYKVDNSKIKAELGMKFRDLQICIHDQVAESIAIEQRTKKA